MKLSKLNKIFIAVLFFITAVLIVRNRPRPYKTKTQEQVKQESLNKGNVTPVVRWYEDRQANSSIDSSDNSYSTVRQEESSSSYSSGSSYSTIRQGGSSSYSSNGSYSSRTNYGGGSSYGK